jgi:hypothetical protein
MVAQLEALRRSTGVAPERFDYLCRDALRSRNLLSAGAAKNKSSNSIDTGKKKSHMKIVSAGGRR